MQYIPYIFEEKGSNYKQSDIISRIFQDRIVLINGPIDDTNVPIVCSQILYLDAKDSTKDIYIYINSPGGSVTSGLAIYDTMQFVDAPITTLCIGCCASMGAFLLAGGTQGHRYSLPHSQIMIHQPSGGYQGQVTDIEIYTKQIATFKKALNNILAYHSKRDVNEIEKITDRDRYLTPEEAVELGIIDGILKNKDDIKNSYLKCDYSVAPQRAGYFVKK